MKTVLLIVGVVAVLVGLLWIGQGAGLVHWPASSFMIDQRPWITRGAILAVVGLVLLAVAKAIAGRSGPRRLSYTSPLVLKLWR